MTDSEKPIAHVPVVCSAVIQKEGKYLLVQEKKPSVYGLWNFPGGRVDEGETLEQAAVREAKEECGIDVKLEEELLLLHQSIEKPVLHAYRATIVSGEVTFPEDEILDAKWFSLDEVKAIQDKLRNVEYILGALEKANN